MIDCSFYVCFICYTALAYSFNVFFGFTAVYITLLLCVYAASVVNTQTYKQINVSRLFTSKTLPVIVGDTLVICCV